MSGSHQPGQIIDLYAGPGGWSEAVKAMGYRELGVEWDEWAVATRRAAGHATIHRDVREVHCPRDGKLWGLIASPPCPSFSAAGKGLGRLDMPKLMSWVRRWERIGWHDPAAWCEWKDERTPLVLEPLRWVDEGQPEWIAFEQVQGVKVLWAAIVPGLTRRGYSTWTGVLNAADYGVPQTRKRAILIASRVKGRKGEVGCPPPTHGKKDGTWVSMADALGWEEPFICRPTTMPNSALRTHDQPAPTDAFGHDVNSWAFIRPATTVCGDPRLSPPGYRGKPENYDAEGNYTGARSMDNAIKLSVEDALVLQSFRPDYPVQGGKGAKFQQIGNAIPPKLATHILAMAIGVGVDHG